MPCNLIIGKRNLCIDLTHTFEEGDVHRNVKVRSYGHKPRDVGILWKLKEAKNKSPLFP